MRSLGEELRENSDEIVQRWYAQWRESSHPRHALGKMALKNSLPDQLRLIGEQLRDLGSAEGVEEIWRISERLDPERRVNQEMPIQEVVQEYALAIDVVRIWIEERHINVPFADYSYFYLAMFELAAESVRRYANYKTEQTRNERGHYLASVMHQLRTPLSALSMQVELLAQSEQQPDAAAIAKLRRNVRRIQVFVDGILRLERFQAWEVPVRPEEVCPARLIDDILIDHEREAARKGLRFEAHINRSLRMTLDPNLFLDALGNLVQNAIHYTSEGFVIVDAKEDSDSVLFSVRDSGPGITPEKQRELFKHTQPGGAGGAGIGLQIAHHAAMAQGGLVEVESAEGKGSVFSLRIPRIVVPRDREAESGR
jgi:two-component system sensor histidine kinase SenX3